jgi:hypothetical protein
MQTEKQMGKHDKGNMCICVCFHCEHDKRGSDKEKTKKPQDTSFAIQYSLLLSKILKQTEKLHSLQAMK